MIIETYTEEEFVAEKSNLGAIVHELDKRPGNGCNVVIDLDESTVLGFSGPEELREYLATRPPEANMLEINDQDSFKRIQGKISDMGYALDYPKNPDNFNFIIDYDNYQVHEFSNEKAQQKFIQKKAEANSLGAR